jgi:hypothetical protein
MGQELEVLIWLEPVEFLLITPLHSVRDQQNVTTDLLGVCTIQDSPFQPSWEPDRCMCHGWPVKSRDDHRMQGRLCTRERELSSKEGNYPDDKPRPLLEHAYPSVWSPPYP